LRKLGKYELLGELGRGAFGVVYRARDPMINRMVALKTMTTGVAENPNLLERFYREAQSAGFLQHPNIVTIYEMGDEAGTPFIAMEMVDGPNLDEVIARHAALPLALKLLYAVQACRAFDYAHKRGIIHRDIKPGNVMVNKEGVIKVVDFGIARILEASKTQTGTLIGTFAYMAPEVFHGEHATERSDIWSFGVLIYEFISYKQPFIGQSPAALMQAICLQEPVALRQVAADCPPDVEALVHRMLRKADAERFQTMEDVLLELEPICRRVQAETAGALLDQAREFMAQGKLAEARDTLRDAMQVDSTNVELRSLSDKVNSELKRQAVRKQAERHVEQGQRLLQEGKPEEASDEVESALQLDSQLEPARKLRQEIQRELERRQRVHQYLESAVQRMIEGLPEEAEALLLKAREADPANSQLRTLEQQIAQEKQRRQQRGRYLEGMQQARQFWIRRKYKECIALLTELLQASPGEDDVLRLLETAREDQAEQDKQERLAKARDLLAEQRFADALALLDALLASDPKDSAVLKLRNLAQREQESQARSEAMQREWDALKKLVNERAYAEAVTRAENLLRQFPGEAALLRLLEFAREQQAQLENDRRLRSAREQVQELLQASRFAEAAAAARAALQSFPGNAELSTLLKQAQAREKKEMVRELIERRIREIKVKINRGQLSEAKELARETLATLGSDTDVSQLLSSAEVEYEAREKRHRQGVQLDGIRALMRERKLTEATTALEAIIQSGDFDALDPRLYQVADEIVAAREKAGAATATLSTEAPKGSVKEYAVAEGPAPASETRAAAAPQPAPQAAPPKPQPAAAAARPEFTPAVLAQAARLLAPYVGPIANVLAKRTAQRADSMRSFYQQLAEYIESKGDRTQFLKAAGFPEA